MSSITRRRTYLLATSLVLIMLSGVAFGDVFTLTENRLLERAIGWVLMALSVAAGWEPAYQTWFGDILPYLDEEFRTER